MGALPVGVVAGPGLSCALACLLGFALWPSVLPALADAVGQPLAHGRDAAPHARRRSGAPVSPLPIFCPARFACAADLLPGPLLQAPRLFRRAAGRGFRARSGILIACRICPPIIPPCTAFCTENHPENLCKKISPHSPLRGNWGAFLAPLTGRKNAGIIRGKRRPHGHRPANRRRPQGHGDQERGGEHDHADRKRIACATDPGGRAAPAFATRQRV